jgi:hypothetical protein
MEKSNMTLYENKYFTVELNEDKDGYDMINKETGVVEFGGAILAEIIMAAQSSESVLDSVKSKSNTAKPVPMTVQ